MGRLGRIPNPFMDESELFDQGFVLEANRQFFHPLGLCLVVQLTEVGRSRVDAALEGLLEQERRLLAGLPASDQKRLGRLLRHVMAPFDDV